MTAALESPERESAGRPASFGTGIETCDAARGLAAINKPGKELVIWRRALPLCLGAWLARMDVSCLPDIRLLVRPRDVRRAVEPLLERSGMPAGDMRDLLLGDVRALVLAFAGITRSDLVDVRLQPVSHDACWKFHRDCVEARLLTTYRGPATEWVQPIHAERALREQKSYKGPLERFRAHDVAIFRGNCSGSGSGIVHRSPPIAGTGTTRILLCLNEQSGASPEPWQGGGRFATSRS